MSDQHIVRLIRRESIFAMDEFSRRINAALGLMPVAMPADQIDDDDEHEKERISQGTKQEGTGVPVDAPTAPAPRSSVVLSGNYPDQWQVQKPSRRSSLIRPIAIVFAAALFTAFLSHVGGIDWHSFGGVAFAWIVLFIFLNKSIVAGLFTPTLFVDTENVRFVRPTLLGFQNPSCNRWALAGLNIVRAPRRARDPSLCQASLVLTLRNGKSIRLFEDLSEEDARWVAQLIASALGMTPAR